MTKREENPVTTTDADGNPVTLPAGSHVAAKTAVKTSTGAIENTTGETTPGVATTNIPEYVPSPAEVEAARQNTTAAAPRGQPVFGPTECTCEGQQWKVTRPVTKDGKTWRVCDGCGARRDD